MKPREAILVAENELRESVAIAAEKFQDQTGLAVAAIEISFIDVATQSGGPETLLGDVKVRWEF